LRHGCRLQSQGKLCLLAVAALLLGGCLDFQGAWKRDHAAFLQLMDVVQHDPTVVAQLGAPIQAGIPQGYFDTAGGAAAFKFQLTGATEVGEGAADMKRLENGDWIALIAWVVDQHGEQILRIEDGRRINE